MKNALALLFLSAYLTASAQYKHFTAGVFATTHNFESGRFYSTPGVSFQYNFKSVFSVNVNYSQEQMKHTEVDNIHGDGGHFLSQKLSYQHIPVAFRATFGRKVGVFAELGFSYSSFYDVEATSHNVEPSGSTEPVVYSSYQYRAKETYWFGLAVGGGLVVPIKERFLVQLSARTGLGSELEDGNDGDHFSYNRTGSYSAWKFSLGLAYNFNLKKNSSYTFTAPYVGRKKNKS